MIYKYRFKNAWSFAEETEVSFMLNRHAPETDSVFTSPRGTRLSKLMAAQGANGAGKTNVLKVLSFLGWFVGHSFAGNRYLPMEIDSHSCLKGENSEIGIEFEHDGEHYHYQLIINPDNVVHESLHHKTSASFSYLFHRDLNRSGGYDIRQKGFDFSYQEAERVRPNASLISTAAQYNVPRARKLADYFGEISANVLRGFDDTRDLSKAARFFLNCPELRRKMVTFMSQVDLGLSNVAIETVPGTDETGEKITDVFPFGIHGHGHSPFKLLLWDESGGTQTAFLLLRKILPALERGGIVAIDELDSGLHPDMVMALLGLFTDTESNPHNAQIIFTSYIPDVMDTLLKEQMLLVEKNSDGCSEAWRLDDIRGIRRDENYYGKYRAGAYGATPNI